mmetsp:Transcript_8976/g.28499  ORF Transcript_8976/g.28499 Transcript_8976/m.28499 type:complete len:213 (-) Transcript_8976:463-1101(-)
MAARKVASSPARRSRQSLRWVGRIRRDMGRSRLGACLSWAGDSVSASPTSSATPARDWVGRVDKQRRSLVRRPAASSSRGRATIAPSPCCERRIAACGTASPSATAIVPPRNSGAPAGSGTPRSSGLPLSSSTKLSCHASPTAFEQPTRSAPSPPSAPSPTAFRASSGNPTKPPSRCPGPSPGPTPTEALTPRRASQSAYTFESPPPRRSSR